MEPTPSIWTTRDRDTLAVSITGDPEQAIGQIRKQGHNWVIVNGRDHDEITFKTMYEAANVLAGAPDQIEYKDYFLGKGEESRTVWTTSEQIQRITDQGHWVMITASAPRTDDVN